MSGGSESPVPLIGSPIADTDPDFAAENQARQHAPPSSQPSPSSSSVPREALQCSHVNAISDLTESEATCKQLCDSCDHSGPNLWLCLHRDCDRFVGCGENGADHSTKHFRDRPEHAITLNLTTFRVWCYLCETEIFLEDYFPQAQAVSGSDRSIVRYRKVSTSAASASGSVANSVGRTQDYHPIFSDKVYVAQDSCDSDSDDDTKSHASGSVSSKKSTSDRRPRGLVGLQNLGNTCYMNAALQALSNCEPLTRFMLECDSFIRKPGLAKSYMRLVREMWDPRRPAYVVPSMIAHGIKNVCPVFRGYAQQDAQEFLRCFLDQLHEELKEVKNKSEEELRSDSQDEQSAIRQQQQHAKQQKAATRARRDASAERHSDRMSVNSDNEYETCDSGLSSEQSDKSAEEVTLMGDHNVPDHCDTNDDTDVTLKDENNDKRPNSSRGMLSEEEARDEPSRLADFSPPLAKKRSKGNSEENFLTADSSSGFVSLQNGSQQTSHASPIRSHIRGASSGGETSSSASHPDSTSSNTTKSSTPSGKEKSDSFRSIICDIFDGKILSSVQCLTCDNVSTTKETFQDLSLPIPGRDHLHVLRSAAAATSSPVQGSLPSSPVISHGQSSLHTVSPSSSSSQLAATLKGENHVTSSSAPGSHSPTPSISRMNVSPSSSMLSLSTVSTIGSYVLSPVTGAYFWFWAWLDWLVGFMWGPAVTLQDCLSAFFSADELKGDNMYSCEKCKKLRNGVKFCRVLKLPEILCIHLKRFRHELMYSSKISNHVSFPLEGLDMSPYMVRNYKDEVTTYDLVAVVVHHGTASSGHYTAYALNHMNDTWYEFDDQYVTSVDAQQVANCEAYVLFYRKSSVEAICRRNRVVDLLKLSVSEPSILHFYVSKQWVNRFNTFADAAGVGPISNWDFLCPHGAVHPDKSSTVHDMCTVFSRSVWEYLHNTFGGGPTCTKLYVCPTCEEAKQVLVSRRKHEYDTITRLNAEFAATRFASNVHCISTSWFQAWESFVRGRSDEPPGPIDNSAICLSWRNGTFLRVGSDYASISADMWSFLESIYGGGPEVTQG